MLCQVVLPRLLSTSAITELINLFVLTAGTVLVATKTAKKKSVVRIISWIPQAILASIETSIERGRLFVLLSCLTNTKWDSFLLVI